MNRERFASLHLVVKKDFSQLTSVQPSPHTVQYHYTDQALVLFTSLLSMEAFFMLAK